MALRSLLLFVSISLIVCVEGCLSQEMLPSPDDVKSGKLTLDSLIERLDVIEKEYRSIYKKDVEAFLHTLSLDILIGIVKKTYPHRRPPFETLIIWELEKSEQGRTILSEFYHDLFTKMPEQTVILLVEGLPFDATYYYLVPEESKAEQYCITKLAARFLADKCEAFSMELSEHISVSIDPDRRVLTIKDTPGRGHELQVISVSPATIRSIVNMLYSRGFFLDTGKGLGYGGARIYLSIGVFIHRTPNYFSPPYVCDHHSVTYFSGEIPDYLKRAAEEIKEFIPR